jgi:CheY-like chemotaxis protein
LEDSRAAEVSPAFVAEVRRTLQNLYEWSDLNVSPLIGLLRLGDRNDPSLALRKAVIGAIEALRPGPQAPPRARAWRTYRVLSARFVEQYTQVEVATDLGLSARHIRREEAAAIDTLAAYLWHHYHLEEGWRQTDGRESPPQEKPVSEELDAGAGTWAQELQWLEQALASESLGAGDLLEAVLATVNPLAEETGVRTRCELPHLPPVLARRAPTREALVALSSAAIRAVPGGEVVISGDARQAVVRIRFRAVAAPGARDKAQLDANQVAVTEQLLGLSGGSVAFERRGVEEGPCAVVTLPADERIPVMVIDDNEDTLRLLERYMSNSRYRFIGVADPDRAVEMAARARPRIITLDVMLPGVDGWELLGRLREHPDLAGVPVVVCSILPQEELAAALGASGIVRKPVTREVFLAALEAQTSPLATGSR